MCQQNTVNAGKNNLSILPEWHMANFKVLHVVGDIHVIMHHSLACAAEGLNSIHLTFLKSNNSAGRYCAYDAVDQP